MLLPRDAGPWERDTRNTEEERRSRFLRQTQGKHNCLQGVHSPGKLSGPPCPLPTISTSCQGWLPAAEASLRASLGLTLSPSHPGHLETDFCQCSMRAVTCCHGQKISPGALVGSAVLEAHWSSPQHCGIRQSWDEADTLCSLLTGGQRLSDQIILAPPGSS